MSRLLALLLASWALSSGRAVADEQADLEGLLRSEHAWVRALAAERLAREPGTRAEAALARTLDDPAPFVRHQAAFAFARKDKPPRQVTDILNASLKSKDWYVRWQACLGLKRLGENAKAAVPRLIHTLCDTELDVCREAALALGSIAPEDERVVVGLAKTLTADHPVDASAVLYSLKLAGTHAQPAIPFLVEASKVHAGAFVLLSAVAIDDQKVLVALANPHNERARVDAVYDLHELKGPNAVRYLRLILDDRSARMRRAALFALRKMGARATVALPAIVRALHDCEPDVRGGALNALRRLQAAIAGQLTVSEGARGGWRHISLDLAPGLWQMDLKELVDDERIGESILDALAEVSDKSKKEIVAAMKAAPPREKK